VPIEFRVLPEAGMLDGLRPLRVADVLELPPFAGARCIAGTEGLDRQVAHINVMQVPTSRFAREGDLVLCADDAFRGSPTPPGALLRALDDRDVAGVVVRHTALARVKPELVAAADELRIALVELPDAAHLSEVLTGTLEALVATQGTELRQAAAVRDQLGGSVLAGDGLDRLPEVVAQLAGGDVAVVADNGRVLAASANADRDEAAAVAAVWLASEANAPALAEREWAVWPVVAGGIRLGCLVARLAGSLESVHMAALEHGANSAALEILHRRAAADADARLRERFVADLLSGSLEPTVARRRAAALGWDPDDRFLVVLARGAGTEASALTARAHCDLRSTVAVERRGACLVIVPAGDDEVAVGSRLADALEAVGPDVHVGISTVAASVDDLPSGLRDADEALRVAEAFDGGGRVRRHDGLGALRLLADVPVGDLHAFAGEVLGGLEAVEPGADGPLFVTLRELIATGLNVAETARRGGWHYNTVRYRVVKLTELVGDFMEDGAVLQDVSLALVLRRELGPATAVRVQLGDAQRDQ
jgi:purine catabolism regulator